MNMWNEALLSKHIWNIVAEKDSMRVKWLHEERDNVNFDALKQILVPLLQDNVEDVVKRKTNEEKLVNFSTGQVWKDISNSNQKVPWKPLMWFSQCCPKHSCYVACCSWEASYSR
nr:hypothetical protein [Tanacetum cinerariifolium]